MDEKKIALTVNEAARYTGIGRNTIRQLINQKDIPVLYIGRKIIIRRESLEDYLRKNEYKNLRHNDF